MLVASILISVFFIKGAILYPYTPEFHEITNYAANSIKIVMGMYTKFRKAFYCGWLNNPYFQLSQLVYPYSNAVNCVYEC